MLENVKLKIEPYWDAGESIFLTARRLASNCLTLGLNLDTVPVLLDALASVAPLSKVMNDVINGSIYATVPWLDLGNGAGYLVEKGAEARGSAWAPVRRTQIVATGNDQSSRLIRVGDSKME